MCGDEEHRVDEIDEGADQGGEQVPYENGSKVYLEKRSSEDTTDGA